MAILIKESNNERLIDNSSSVFLFAWTNFRRAQLNTKDWKDVSSSHKAVQYWDSDPGICFQPWTNLEIKIKTYYFFNLHKINYWSHLWYAFSDNFLDLEAKILVYKQDWASTNFWKARPVQFVASLNPWTSNLLDQSKAASSSFAIVSLHR